MILGADTVVVPSRKGTGGSLRNRAEEFVAMIAEGIPQWADAARTARLCVPYDADMKLAVEASI